MIGHLYRYPHPHDPIRFIYCGQGPKRDKQHRGGKVGFGRLFKKTFPGVELPKPIREEIEVKDHLELNELETIWMFQYHTWRGYDGGMNQIIPGSQDYKTTGFLGGVISGRRAVESGQLARARALPQTRAGLQESGRKAVESGRLNGQGRKNIENGSIQALGLIYGPINGRKSVENGHLASIRTPESIRKGGIASGHQKAVNKTGVCGRTPEKMTEDGHKGGLISGRRNAESGQMARIQKMGAALGGRIGGRIVCCFRWNISRNKPCVCGKHLVSQD